MLHYTLAVKNLPQLLEAILDELVELGHERAKVFKAAGVGTAKTFIESALSATERSKLFNYSCCLLAAESGQKGGFNSFVKKTVTDMLMYSVINSKNLNEVIERTAAFCSMVESIGINLVLTNQGQQTKLTIEIRQTSSKQSSLLLTLAAMSTFYYLFSWLIATDLPLEQVGLCHEKPNKPMPVGPLQNFPTLYQCHNNYFIFSTTWLQQPVTRNYNQLTQVIDYFPVSLLSVGTSNQLLTTRVEGIIQASLNGSVAAVTAEIMAQLVNLSPATLRRKLRNEGTDFTQLLTKYQRIEAEKCLINQVPIKAIALQLGFSDDRAFRRAFKRWCGQTPTEFRQKHQQNKADRNDNV